MSHEATEIEALEIEAVKIEAIEVIDDQASEFAASLFEDTPEALTGVPFRHRRREGISWVYFDADPSKAAPQAVVKIITSDDPESYLGDIRRHVQLVDDLRTDAGISVLEHLAEPQSSDNMIATVTRYLPGEDVSMRYYGIELGWLNALGASNTLVNRVPDFDPLRVARETYDYLNEKITTGDRLVSDDIEFTSEDLGILDNWLLVGERAVSGLCEIWDDGEPLSIAQMDVTPHNVRTDYNGEAVLIDLEGLMRARGEFSLSQPAGQWRQHFKRPAHMVDDLIAGYKEIAGGVNLQALDLSIKISNIRSTVELITNAVASERAGVTPSAWVLREGIARLRHLDDREYEWHSEEGHLRRNR